MRKAARFLQGAIMGGIIGGVTVILLAPQSGESTRAEINRRFSQLRKQVQEEIQKRRAELQSEFESYTKI